MYAVTELMYPDFHDFSQVEDIGSSHKSNASLGTPSSIVEASDYNLWEEGDLFNAPQPVIEEPVMGLDPMTAAISMIFCGEDGISPQSFIESGQLLSEVFYECRKDIMAKEGNETPQSQVLTTNIPTDEKSITDSSFQKSVSSSCLKSMEATLRPNFLDFPAVDFEAVYGMRRAFSEGDIKTLGNGNANHAQSPLPRIMSSCSSDGRREKLSRYWSKKARRNFGRKIKYACRKALADSQPRIRGRFAKTYETEGVKKQ